MLKIFLILCLILTIYLVVEVFKFYSKVKISKEIINSSQKFENLSNDFSKTILVLGDSTAFGVGTKEKNDSIAGQLANFTNATYVENLSVSGAQIHDLKNQLKNIKNINENNKSYDYILIQIGGNDIIRFHSVEKQKEMFTEFLKTLPNYKKLIVISVGNVGDATLFPFFIRPLHSNFSLKYHKMFEEILNEQKKVNPNSYYVNLHEPNKSKNKFLLYPEIYLSKDGLHPSSAGYKLWFEKIVPSGRIEPPSIP